MGHKKKWCTFVPDFNFGEKCCKPHDNCYTIGGTKEDKLKCDIAFRRCIISSYPNYILKPIYFLIGWMYYLGVRLFGKNRFKSKE